MRRRLLAAVIVVGAAACGGGTAPVRDAQREANLQARFEAWVRAWNSRSPDSLAPFYVQASYLTVAWPNGERNTGWEAESTYLRQFLPTVETANLVPRSPRVVLMRSNLALVSFPFSLDFTAGGQRQVGPGLGMMVWQYEAGAWRIYAAQLSYTRAVEAEVGELRRSGR